jgi:hypothetical protein
MLVCDKCGASINAGSRFCAQCGDPVTEADVVTTAASSPEGVTAQISFGYSTSPAYSKAVAICERLPSYEVSGEGKQIQHKIVLPLSEVELVANIFDLVGSWKSSQMLINGQSATKKDLSYYGVGCYRTRQKAYKPDAYCYGERQYDANIWGCKKLGMPVFECGGGWLDYGQFDAKGAWHFDKARIKHELEVALKENELCPALNRARVLETLENLPTSVDPKTDKNWQYRTSYEEVKGDYKEVAVGIRPVLKKVNRYIIGGFKPEWEEESPPASATTIQIKVEPPRSLSPSPSAAARRGKKSYTWLWVILGILVLISLFR